MRLLKGDYIITGRYGEPYAESVLKAFPYLRNAPWYGKCIAYEVAPRPYGSVGEVLLPCPVLVSNVWTRSSDGAKVITCKVNIANHPYQGWAFEIWHFGKVEVSKGQWLGAGHLVGYVGGQYKWSGAGTGAHIALTLKNPKGEYIDPQPLINWQPTIVQKVVEVIKEAILPSPEEKVDRIEEEVVVDSPKEEKPPEITEFEATVETTEGGELEVKSWGDFFNKIRATLASSKFQVFLGTVLAVWATSLKGEISAQAAVTATVIAALGYMGFRALEDGLKSSY